VTTPDKQYLAKIAEENKRYIIQGYVPLDNKRIYLDYTQGARTFVPEEPLDLSGSMKRSYARVSVEDIDVISAALQNPGCMLLNFASGFHAGGGYLRGTTAQEEVLCRCSTLYAQINNNSMYAYSRWKDPTHIDKAAGLGRTNGLCTDVLSVTTDTKIFRDSNYKLIYPVNVQVITCAAPNYGGFSDGRLKENPAIMDSRIRRIVDVAILYKNPVLLLGAFGCGAFNNNPTIVAGIFKKVLIDERKVEYFDRVIFSIPAFGDSKNYSVFKEILQ
jgi:uncharacterized protein (TIGR02452 family)